MNIYFIAEKQTFKQIYIDKISRFGNILYLSDNNNENYSILKQDNNEKIIIYDPDYAGWKIPNNILKDIKNLRAIFLGTTDKSYVDLDVCKEKDIDVINIPKYARRKCCRISSYVYVCFIKENSTSNKKS